MLIMMQLKRLLKNLNKIGQKNITTIDRSSTITLSIGGAYYPKHGKNYQELWSNADKALYLSKNNGRNRISNISTLNSSRKGTVLCLK